MRINYKVLRAAHFDHFLDQTPLSPINNLICLLLKVSQKAVESFLSRDLAQNHLLFFYLKRKSWDQCLRGIIPLVGWCYEFGKQFQLRKDQRFIFAIFKKSQRAQQKEECYRSAVQFNSGWGFYKFYKKRLKEAGIEQSNFIEVNKNAQKEQNPQRKSELERTAQSHLETISRLEREALNHLKRAALLQEPKAYLAYYNSDKTHNRSLLGLMGASNVNKCIFAAASALPESKAKDILLNRCGDYPPALFESGKKFELGPLPSLAFPEYWKAWSKGGIEEALERLLDLWHIDDAQHNAVMNHPRPTARMKYLQARSLFLRGLVESPQYWQLFQQSAQEGHPRAAYEYALAHVVNVAQKVELFKKAAKANHYPAQYELGKIYIAHLKGEIVNGDIPKPTLEETHALLLSAVNIGNVPGAQESLDQLLQLQKQA